MEAGVLTSTGAPEVVSRTARTLVVRRARGGRTVIVKSPAAEVPTAAELARYRHEFALLRHVEADGVVRALELVEQAGRIELVLEDVGGRSLAALLRDGPLPVERAAAILLGAAEALAKVHAAGVVHKDVNPANLVWSEGLGAVQLIDFSIASRLARERCAAAAPEALEGTLPYLAPEQSGRMSRGVDHRADLYALGATAWHLLVGKPPFAAPDALGLVHAHLAQVPRAPHALRGDVPPALSAVVLKLLAKDPDDRYQSAAGVAADLRRHLRGEAFTPGAEDGPSTFLIPERLYGRGAEQAALLDVFAASRERARVAIVAARSGSGKSSLVASLRAPVVERGGAFAAGRFEMLRRETPYLAIADAFGALLRDVLAGSAAEVAAWKARLEAALGPNRALVAVPGLDALLGPAEAPAVGPEETRVRSRVAFAALLRAFAAERPLLLSLDDLQWADVASLELIAFLAADPELRGVLLVLGFRDDEVEAASPLLRLGEGAVRVTPGPLTLADLTEMVADACRTTADEAAPLAALLLEKTAGNAFFARATLERLHRDGLLTAAGGGWRWDLDAIRAVEPADNVVALMVRSLRELPDASQDALRVAACVGQRFELSVVAAAVGRSPREVAADLWPALERGLVAPEGGSYALAEHRDDGDAGYRFAHDRVQEAAASLLPEAERAPVHLAIGRALKARGVDGASLFAVAAHLAEGVPAMDDPAERRGFAEIALAAGRRARGTAAFATAFGFFEAGLSALGGWGEAPELARELTRASADSALLAGDVARMERRVDELLARSRGLLDTILASCARVRARMALGDLRGALAIALPLFDRAGMPLPTDGNPLATALAFARARAALGLRGPEDLRALPPSTDPLLLAVHELRSLTPIAHALIHPEAIPRAILVEVRCALEAGVATGYSAWIWAGYAIVQVTLGDLDLAARFIALAVCECERLRPQLLPRVRLLDALIVRAWREPLAPLIETLERNVPRTLEFGDVEFASRSALSALAMSFFAGTELDRLEATLHGFSRAIDHHGVALGAARNRVMLEALRVLTDPAPSVARQLPDAGLADPSTEGFVVCAGLLVALAYGDDARAEALAERGFTSLDSPTATVFAMFFWTYALVVSAARREPGRRERKGLRVLERWVRACPSDRAWRLAWVDATHAARAGRLDEALGAYDRAVEGARASGHRQDAALVAEQAARYLEARGRRRAARGYRQEACAGYRQWGATAKVAEMVARNPELAEAEGLTASISTTGGGGKLDLESVLRAAQALTGEIRLDVLVGRLMAIALENAGAERGALLLPRGGAWVLAAEADTAGARHPGEAVDLDATERFPATVLRSAVRAREPLVLADAAREWTSRDPYVERVAPRSVLCLPLLDRDELSGVLYLENNLAPGAFTRERLEVLRTVSGQMAVSLRAAELYGETLELKRSFERFVPKDFLDNLGRRSAAEVRLGDSVQKEMTVLFSDIRSFTSLVEGMSPEENIEFINEYLGRMEPAIAEHGGFIDSYIGDAIMALFDRGADALAAAVEMLRTLRRYNAERALRGREALAIGAGVNTGVLTLGTIGGEGHLKCGVIGDCVNLAARVESLTKSYQVSLLTTEHTRAALPDPGRFRMRAVDRVRVVGRVEPVTLYEVYDADEGSAVDAKDAVAERWELALAAYYGRDFAGAEALFAECARALGADPIAARYVERARRHAASAPGPEWAGVEVLDHK